MTGDRATTVGDPRATQRFFEDVAVGDRFEVPWQPDLAQVRAWIDLTGMFAEDRRVFDLEAARAGGLDRPIVPGPISVIMLERLVTDWMGPLGRIQNLTVSYRRAVLHDDLMRCIALVIDVHGDGDYEGTPEGAVSLDVSLENERGEKPVLGTAVVVMPRRD